MSMLSSYITTAVRNALRNKTYAVINMLGLAVGIACAILTWLYYDFESSWDTFRPHADRVYRVMRHGPTPYGPVPKPYEGLSGLVGPALAESFPEVEETVRMRIGARWIGYDEHTQRTLFWYADPNFLDFFGFRLQRGDPATALTTPFGIVLNPDIVEEYFGDEDPVGKTMRGQDGEFVVTGILEPMPRNSMLAFNFLTSTVPAHIKRNAAWDSFDSPPRERRTVTFIRLAEGADVDALSAKLPAFGRTILPDSDREEEFVLQSLLRMRLRVREDFPDGYDGLASGMAPGNTEYIRILVIIGGFILLVACINFMNLATARSTLRAREIGVRKSVGASRGQIAAQFLGESVILSLLSLPLAWALVDRAFPVWDAYVGQSYAPDLFARPSLILFVLGITLLTGLVSGSYPALYLSRFEATSVLRGQAISTGRSGAIRRALVVFQFAISIVLITGTLVAFRQITFVRGKDLGFNRDNILAVRIFDNDSGLRRDYNAVKLRFARHPAVLAISASASLPGEGWTADRRAYEPPDRPGTKMQVRNFSIDEDWFPYIGVDILAGRNFSPERATDYTEAYILNETAVRDFGLEDPIGAPLDWNGRKGHVIGVVRDHHTRDLFERINPYIFTMEPRRYRVITMRFDPTRLSELMAFLEDTWKEYIPGRPLVYAFLDERLELEYRREVRFQSICAAAFGLAVFVACLGLLGLAAFTAERRTREIGIRKAVGADGRDIVTLLSREFAFLVLIANIVAAPVAYAYMEGWLNRFAYRIDQGILPFVGAGALSLFLATATVSWQAWLAARTNPVDALRCE